MSDRWELVIVNGIEYKVCHLSSSYSLHDKQYGPESYLVMGPDDEYANAMTGEEYRKWIKKE